MGIFDKFMRKVNPDTGDDYDDSYVFDGADDDNGAQGQYGGYDNGYQQQQMQNTQMNMNGNMAGMNNMNNNMGNMGNNMGYAPQAQQYNPYGPQNQGQITLDSSSSMELKVIRPERRDMVFQIADHLLNGRTVVLNLEATNGENQRRMIDFLSGVVYSIGGDLRKVTAKTYVITPSTVRVGDPEQAERGGGMDGFAQGQGQGGERDLFGDI